MIRRRQASLIALGCNLGAVALIWGPFDEGSARLLVLDLDLMALVRGPCPGSFRADLLELALVVAINR